VPVKLAKRSRLERHVDARELVGDGKPGNVRFLGRAGDLEYEGPFFSPALIVYDMLVKLVRSSAAQIVLDGIGVMNSLLGLAGTFHSL
jgi:hypothetical protein